MKLYLRYAAIHFKSQMQYKTSFFLTLLGQFLTAFATFLGIWVMFTRFNTVDGYTYAEVSLCYAVVLMAFSLAETFFRGFDTFPRMIGNGEFDRILVRPRSPIFQVLAAKIEFSRLGRLVQAVTVFAWAIPSSGVDWTPANVATLIGMIIAGTFIFAGLFLIYAGVCFFTLDGLEVMNIFTDGGREFGRYPLSVYGEGVLRFLTYVVPLALFLYYPFLTLIGRSDLLLYRLCPAFSLLFLLPCYLFWRIGLRHYKSTGS